MSVDDYLEKCEEMQKLVLNAISALIALNPDKDSAEGILLIELAVAQSKYEDARGWSAGDL